MQFFKSNDVKIFPCSTRGSYVTTLTENGAESQINRVFDPEARLASEYNLTHLSGNVLGKESYVIDHNNGILRAVIGGYYIEIKLPNNLPLALNNLPSIKLVTCLRTTKLLAETEGSDFDPNRKYTSISSVFKHVPALNDVTDNDVNIGKKYMFDGAVRTVPYAQLDCLDVPADYYKEGTSELDNTLYYCTAVGYLIKQQDSEYPNFEPTSSDPGEIGIVYTVKELDLADASNWLHNLAASEFIWTTDRTDGIQLANNLSLKKLKAQEDVVAGGDVVAGEAGEHSLTHKYDAANLETDLKEFYKKIYGNTNIPEEPNDVLTLSSLKGAIETTQTDLIGSTDAASDSNTIYGAKAYAEEHIKVLGDTLYGEGKVKDITLTSLNAEIERLVTQGGEPNNLNKLTVGTTELTITDKTINLDGQLALSNLTDGAKLTADVASHETTLTNHTADLEDLKNFVGDTNLGEDSTPLNDLLNAFKTDLAVQFDTLESDLVCGNDYDPESESFSKEFNSTSHTVIGAKDYAKGKAEEEAKKVLNLLLYGSEDEPETLPGNLDALNMTALEPRLSTAESTLKELEDNRYVHPTLMPEENLPTLGLYEIAVTAEGHISEVKKFEFDTSSLLGELPDATSEKAGLMSTADKSALDALKSKKYVENIQVATGSEGLLAITQKAAEADSTTNYEISLNTDKLANSLAGPLGISDLDVSALNQSLGTLNTDLSALGTRIDEIEARIAPATGGTNIYAVAFDANGGSGEMTPVVCITGSYTLPTSTFTAPTGMTFSGWSLTVDGQTLSDESSLILSGNTILHAIWVSDLEIEDEGTTAT